MSPVSQSLDLEPLDAGSDDDGPRNWTTSRGVIANSRDQRGVVLWCSAGSVLEEQIAQINEELGPLGLDDAPHGISIWEGDFVWRWSTCDLDPVGTFREPTDEEWAAIRAGKNPLPDERPEAEREEGTGARTITADELLPGGVLASACRTCGGCAELVTFDRVGDGRFPCPTCCPEDYARFAETPAGQRLGLTPKHIKEDS